MHKALRDLRRLEQAKKKKAQEKKEPKVLCDSGCQTEKPRKREQTRSVQTSEQDLAFSRHSRILQVEKTYLKGKQEKNEDKKRTDVACGPDPPITNTMRFMQEETGRLAMPQKPKAREPIKNIAPMKRSNTSSNLSEARRLRLERLLEREERKPYLSAQERERQQRQARLREQEVDFDCYEEDGSGGWDEEEQDGPVNFVHHVIGDEFEFFNGCSVIGHEHLNPRTGNSNVDPLEFDDITSFAIEMWTLPINDHSTDRDLRTKRSGLSFNSNLLTRSEGGADWKYLVRKGLPSQSIKNHNINTKVHGLQGCSLNKLKVSNQDLSTPTILYNQRTGQIRVGLVLREWHEAEQKIESDSLSHLLSSQTVAWIESEAKLSFSTWNHLALVISPLQATLFINGKRDGYLVPNESKSERIAFNWGSFYFGANPSLSSVSGGKIVGENGFIGFMHGVKIGSGIQDLTAFQFPWSEDIIPPYPQARNEWGDLSQAEENLNGQSPAYFGCIGGTGANATKRQLEQREQIRRDLQFQMDEKKERSMLERMEREKEERKVALMLQNDRLNAQLEKQHKDLQKRANHEEMQHQMELALERKRLEALQELEEDLMHSRTSFQGGQNSSRRRVVDTAYCKEMMQLADFKRRQKELAMESAKLEERVALEAELLDIEREKQQARLDKLRKQHEFRIGLEQQIEEHKRSNAYGGKQLLNADERGMNLKILQLLDNERKLRADGSTVSSPLAHSAFSVLTRNDFNRALDLAAQ